MCCGSCKAAAEAGGVAALVALADTPLLYLGTWAHRKWAGPHPAELDA